MTVIHILRGSCNSFKCLPSSFSNSMRARAKIEQRIRNNFQIKAMTTDPNLNAVALQVTEQARDAKSSTSIPEHARSVTASTSIHNPVAVAPFAPDPTAAAPFEPVPNAEVPILAVGTLEAVRNTGSLLDARERLMTTQLRLGRAFDEHDPHERSSVVHAALVEADAVALSQRIVRASMITDPSTVTVFDKIITKAIPAFVVYEDEDVLAFHDSAPQAPVHIVIIPKFRDGLTGLSTAEERHKQILGQLLYTASRVAKMEDGLRDGYRIVINEGGWGGQTVLHLHLHLLGGRFMAWPPG
ncbi:hypothetical protein KC19_VG146900 [Ceratodon purpureus]|uniref:HIT domain-containing protein n=1 Tax=Ceratodon purpureus TaxID=3225 RepID=A0A8T0HRA2_CERPU|nr:hypothetical protein KC19_VG146900 [Ceratodon purpureus]